MNINIDALRAAIAALNDAVAELDRDGFQVELRDGSLMNSMKARGDLIASVSSRPVEVSAGQL